MFADPPDNINLGYDEYDDGIEVEKYIDFINKVFSFGVQHCRTSYVSFNAKWMTEVGALLKVFKTLSPELEIRYLIQGFTFGQNRRTDHGNNFRPIVRIRNLDSPLFPDRIRVESDRMKMGDKRANPRGKVPGDVWFSDFLEYPRVTGNSKQRRTWSPTQLHEGLVEDCLLMSTPDNGYVIDPFAGTGTTLRVCLKNSWNCETCDLSSGCCRHIIEEHGFKSVNPGLWTLTKERANV